MLGADPEAGTGEHRGASGQKDGLPEDGAVDVGVRPDQAGPTDDGGVALAAADQCLLHDDDLLAELDPAALGGHHGTKEDPALVADDHLACDDRVGGHIGRRRDLWPPSLMLDQHWPSSPGQEHPPGQRP
jgi:hypothetical protein